MHLLLLIATGIVTFLVANRLIDLFIEYLQVRKHQFSMQEKLIEEYGNLASRFLRLTNDKEHPLIREAVVCMPSVIYDGSLAQHFFAFQISKRKIETTEGSRKASAEFKKLTDPQLDLLSSLLGCGLLASTYSLPISGGVVRQGLSSVMDAKNHKVASPNQVVARVRTVVKKNKAPLEHCAVAA